MASFGRRSRSAAPAAESQSGTESNTGVRTSGSGAAIPAAPVPRRLGRPSWLDPRLVLGLLLVVGCALVGAKVLRASQQTIAVWKVERSLSAGTVLTESDLVRTDLHLADVSGAYVGADQAVAGMVLGRAVEAGELLPVAAVQSDQKPGRLMNLGVPVGNMPPGVRHGSTIDVYLVRGSRSASGTVTTQRVATAVTVQDVIAPSGGGLSGAGHANHQVVLLLDPATADTLVKQLPTGEPLVLLATAGQR